MRYKHETQWSASKYKRLDEGHTFKPKSLKLEIALMLNKRTQKNSILNRKQ